MGESNQHSSSSVTFSFRFVTGLFIENSVLDQYENEVITFICSTRSNEKRAIPCEQCHDHEKYHPKIASSTRDLLSIQK